MAGFIQNILWNSVEGFVEAGTRSVGQYAGDALMKAGDIIEETGRGVGTSMYCLPFQQALHPHPNTPPSIYVGSRVKRDFD
jgi:hypothetical protein